MDRSTGTGGRRVITTDLITAEVRRYCSQYQEQQIVPLPWSATDPARTQPQDQAVRS